MTKFDCPICGGITTIKKHNALARGIIRRARGCKSCKSVFVTYQQPGGAETTDAASIPEPQDGPRFYGPEGPAIHREWLGQMLAEVAR